MAEFNTPDTRLEVYQKTQADVSIETGGNALKVNSYKILLASLAPRIFDLYKKRLNINKQSFIKTCDDEYLSYHGEPYNITLNSAKPAEGQVIFSGDNGYTIPSNSNIQSPNGIVYATQSDGTISLQQITPISISRTGTKVTIVFSTPHNLASGFIIDSITGANQSDFNVSNQVVVASSSTILEFDKAGVQGAATGTIIVQWKSVSIPVKATTSGNITNQDPSTLLQLTSPIANINTNCFVGLDSLSNGTDVEDNASYRSRIEYRMANPVAYFNNSFIISECKKISGVTRVQVFNPTSTTSQKTISSITRYDNVAIATCNNHGLTDNSSIFVNGANPSDYNGIKKIIILDTNRFAYKVNGSPANPTGTITFSYSYVQPGQVKVAILRDKDASIIPSSIEVQKVKNQLALSLPSHTDINDVIVFSPTAVPQNFTFSYLYPNTNAMKDAIKNSLDKYFRSLNQVGVSDKIATLRAVIDNTFDPAGNKPNYTLASPTNDNSIGENQISILGTITYQ